ncbi:membrane protein [Petrotoga sp. 9T1HF07.CasAA.8.2]|uniref:glycerol-3-phosphate 1-O-acyltransferase PlsY n=1 Tax=Petrotoga sp. 9T1HF07.CasAA.8.2 TaxID=1434329 RepID=UPI000CB4172F|nr:glycerol-3-phosphate 1-O-acyltransferase PlsY [Petrotoga sp. 9T1HF07.CasAA.8.2]PNR87646.1 membrane protein [Petrotoga sp. 9T1HF07.CasAA.8.2]
MSIAALIISYLCGSIPFSFLIPWSKGIDIRKTGSGNVGGTNVLRALGPKWGLLSITLDFLKAFIPILIIRLIFGVDSWVPYLSLIVLVLGHDYPIFLKFKGGKGVASTLGGYFALSPLLGAIFLLVWIPVELSTKYVSLSSLLGLLVTAILGYFLDTKMGITYTILFLLSLYKHRSNIKRLLSNSENKTDIIKILQRKEELK